MYTQDAKEHLKLVQIIS